MINVILATILLWLFSYIYVIIDDIVDDIIIFIKYKILNQKPKVSRDIFKDLKNSPAREAYLYVYRFFFHIKEFPESFYYDTKYFIQRGLQGWSHRDVWSIDWFLTSIMPPMLKRLKDTGHTMPTWEEGKSDEQCKKEWDDIIDSIIYIFEVSKNIHEHHWIIQESSKYDIKFDKKYIKLNKELKEKEPKLFNNEKDLHVMTIQECYKYEEGWENFRKYFYQLWD